MKRGFTLIELLVVIAIIVLVSAVALPTIIPAMSHRQVSEASRVLQGAIVGARDAAIRDNAPTGIRLLPDPATPGCFNRIQPLSQPASYGEGFVSVFVPSSANPYPASVTQGTLALVLEEQIVNSAGVINSPVSWAWNVRVGDTIQIGGVGPTYTIAGPMVDANPEGFVNYGPPGTVSPVTRGTGHPEFLLLTNGQDDNANSWIDEGWDGVDNDATNGIDDLAEWEQEAWHGSLARGEIGLTYSIRRRPIPDAASRETVLPSNVVIELARSSIQANALLGTTDLVIQPDGSMLPALLYSSPASIGLGNQFFQFWLSERSDVGVAVPKGQNWLLSVNGKSGNITSAESPDLQNGLAAARRQ